MVHIWMRDANNECDEIWIGHLDMVSDPQCCGEITSFATLHVDENDERLYPGIEGYFDPFTTPDGMPLIPRSIDIISPDELRVSGYSDGGDFQTLSLDDDDDGSQWDAIMRGAYRVLERQRRSEPVLLAYDDGRPIADTLDEMDRYWDPPVKLRGPPSQVKALRRLPPFRPEAGPFRTVSVTARRAEKDRRWPDFELTCVLNGNGFMTRRVPVFASMSRAGDGLGPVRFDIDGHIEGDLRPLRWRCARTNLFGRNVDKRENFLVWNDTYVQSEVYCIESVTEVQFHDFNGVGAPPAAK